MRRAEIIERLEKAATWRPVPSWPYEASNTGLLRSASTGRVLKPTLSHNGYQRCTFQANKVRKYVRVHRAVAEAWLGQIPTGYHVNHKDGDKLNNSPCNLEIVTSLENHRHATLHGLKARGNRNGVHTQPHRVARGERAARAKLSTDQVLQIRKLRLRGQKLTELASQFGVDQSLISQVCRRKIWTHV